MRVRELSRIADCPASAWDALFPADYPFIRHAFLDALERHACVGGRSGWEPCHLVIDDDAGDVVAAAPLYRKRHSYGEFVFDFAWAQASERLGRRYYPKLVCAIPFSPVTGPRLGARDPAARAQLARALAGRLADAQLSSVHALFLEPGDLALLAEHGFVERQDVQFHWRNAGHADFAAFAATLRSDKRRKILRERRRVAEAGIRFEASSGAALPESRWAEVYALYAHTYAERGQRPYLSFEFFLDYGRRPETPLRLITAWHDTRLVAAAITLVGGDTLYGRHWGALAHYHSLHFEACYYQGIELCIREGLARFDAGAQGEHKLARGFLPVTTHSAHLLADQRLHTAVADHLTGERAWIESQEAELFRHAPYRQERDAPGDHEVARTRDAGDD